MLGSFPVALDSLLTPYKVDVIRRGLAADSLMRWARRQPLIPDLLMPTSMNVGGQCRHPWR